MPVVVGSLVCFGAISKGYCIIRIEPDCLIEILYCLIVLTLFEVHDTSIVECSGVVWIELDRFIVIFNGAIVVTFCRISIAAVVMGNGQDIRLLIAQVDQRRATPYLKVGRCAV